MRLSTDTSLVRSLFRFHWAAGARVALRANALTLGIVVFAFGYAPDALDTLRHYILKVVAATTGSGRGQRLLLTAIAALLALAAVQRVSLGSRVWMRSLPMDRRATWRAAVGAAVASQIAVVIFALLGSLATLAIYHAPLSTAKVVTIPLIMIGVAMVVVPASNPFGRIAAVMATDAAIRATWPMAGAAVVLLIVADAVGGESPVSQRRLWRHRPGTISGVSSAGWIWFRASWRAVGLRRLIGSAFVPTVATAFAYFITRNNPELSARTDATIARVCGGIAVAAFVAGVANSLFVGRQPWVWARSLPWSAKRRVIADLWVVGIPMVAIPIALLPLGWAQALGVAAGIPTAAALGAAAMRGVGARQTGAAGESFVLSLCLNVAIGLWPPIALVSLALFPLVLRWGAHRDRAWRVTRWTELHHSAAGDPTWLTQ
ncbi:MAG: hypothetical protein ABJF01_00635 [bacterium]